MEKEAGELWLARLFFYAPINKRLASCSFKQSRNYLENWEAHLSSAEGTIEESPDDVMPVLAVIDRPMQVTPTTPHANFPQVAIDRVIR